MSYRLSAALMLSLGLAACGATMPVASRNALLALDPIAAPAATQAQASGVAMITPQFNVQAVNISVPDDLRVSEANVYYPIADIVWRGDPYGERHDQVKTIFQDAMATGTAGFTSGRPVVIDIEITRFHCLTEKTRFSFGGVHSVKFILTLRDAQSGAVIEAPRLVVADIKASGGAVAMAEEARGLTQRIVIESHLVEVIKRELRRPVPAAMPAPAAPIGALTMLDLDPTRLALALVE